MKKLALLAFSVLLLVPAGSQNALADKSITFFDGCELTSPIGGFSADEDLVVNNSNLFPITVSLSGSIISPPVSIPAGGQQTFDAPDAGPYGQFIIACSGGALGSLSHQGHVISIQVCGNGIIETPEECDDAGDSATCDSDCTFAQCGDSYANIAAGEQCDDGNGDNGDTCTSICLAAVCGDGIIWDADDIPPGPEQCDDGNFADGDGCSMSCMVESGAGFDCGPKTEPIAGLCVPIIEEICGDGTMVQNMMCVAQSMGSMIGGALLDIDTTALLVASIGVNPVITGLVGITIAGIAGQAIWFVHRRRKSENS